MFKSRFNKNYARYTYGQALDFHQLHIILVTRLFTHHGHPDNSPPTTSHCTVVPRYNFITCPVNYNADLVILIHYSRCRKDTSERIEQFFLQMRQIWYRWKALSVLSTEWSHPRAKNAYCDLQRPIKADIFAKYGAHSVAY